MVSPDDLLSKGCGAETSIQMGPAERAGGGGGVAVCITFFYRYSYEPRHFMTQDEAPISAKTQRSFPQIPAVDP
jgi:hypothetical protein